MNRLLTVPWLVVLWLMLWRDVSIANVLSGVVVAMVVSLGLRLDWAGTRRSEHRLHPLALVRFLAYFAWKLLEANVVLAREVVTPRNHIKTGIIAVPLSGCTDLIATVVGNAVSLTPGTLTVEVSETTPRTLYVHVLHLHDIEHARRDVHELAHLAAAAFGHHHALDTDHEAQAQ